MVFCWLCSPIHFFSLICAFILQPSRNSQWQLMWGSASQTQTFRTPSVLCSHFSYVTRNRHTCKYEPSFFYFLNNGCCFGPQAALWGHSNITSLLKRDFSDFIWPVGGRWQNERLWFCNSSHEQWLFPPCRCFHFLRFYSCLRCCVPAVWEITGMLSLRGCFRSPTNFCLSEKAAAALMILGRGKSGVCKSHQCKAPLLWCLVEFHWIHQQNNSPPSVPWLQFSTSVCGFSLKCSAKFLLVC